MAVENGIDQRSKLHGTAANVHGVVVQRLLPDGDTHRAADQVGVGELLARPLVGAIAFAATGLIDFFGGTIARDGNVLTDTATGATVHVTQACDGLGVFAVFAAMIVGLCRSVKTSLAAIATLFVAMQVFNLIRVIALFHLRSAAQDVYDVSHLFIMPWTTALIGWLIVWRVWARAR